MVKILVVDNDTNTLQTICLSLQLGKFQTFKAAGGQQAIDFLKKRKVDLILCDIMMPEIDGIQVCKILAEDQDLKDIPIILISALPVQSSNFRSALKTTENLTNVKGAIEKPFQVFDLLKKIEQTLN